MAELSSIKLDFGFRKGNQSDLSGAELLDGHFYVCKDSREFGVDLDGTRIPLGDIIKDFTEAEIKAIGVPENKLYLSSDTSKLFYFNRKKLEWVEIGGRSTIAESAINDIDGNPITDTYETKSDAESEYEDINNQIENLKSIVTGLVKGMAINVYDSIEDLPDEGEEGLLYLVKQPDEKEESDDSSDDSSSSDDDSSDVDPQEQNTIYDQYVWTMTDIGYAYVKIGTSQADLENYYKKQEIDYLFEVFSSEIESSMSALEESINSKLQVMRNQVEGNTAAINSLDTKVDNMAAQITNNILSEINNIKQAYLEADLAYEQAE